MRRAPRGWLAKRVEVNYFPVSHSRFRVCAFSPASGLPVFTRALSTSTSSSSLSSSPSSPPPPTPNRLSPRAGSSPSRAFHLIFRPEEHPVRRRRRRRHRGCRRARARARDASDRRETRTTVPTIMPTTTVPTTTVPTTAPTVLSSSSDFLRRGVSRRLCRRRRRRPYRPPSPPPPAHTLTRRLRFELATRGSVPGRSRAGLHRARHGGAPAVTCAPAAAPPQSPRRRAPRRPALRHATNALAT